MRPAAPLWPPSASISLFSAPQHSPRPVRSRGRGIGSIDAPVSGGDLGARNATLAIMCGGQAEAIEAVRPLFEKMGKVNVLGGPGAGQSCKMANQVTICTTMIGLCEGIVYAHKAGLDVDAYLVRAAFLPIMRFTLFHMSRRCLPWLPSAEG